MSYRLTFFALLASMLFAGQMQADTISEFFGNPPGTDPTDQDVELLGTPNASFDLWIVSIESDPTTSDTAAGEGVVDRASNVMGTYDANGIAVVSIPDLENPSFTLILADDFTGTVGDTDIDTDNDGIVDDDSAFVGVQDAIGVLEDVGDPGYGAQFGGDDFTANGNSSDPINVFRDGVTGAWYAVDPGLDLPVFDINGELVDSTAFDLDPTVATFGSVNPSLEGGSGPVLRGDANCDGIVNFDDIGPFIGFLSSDDFKAEADVDASGEINFADIAPLIAILAGT